MGSERIRVPRAKVRKGTSEKVRKTKVHEVGHRRPEPTIEDGLEDFYQDNDARLWDAQVEAAYQEYVRERAQDRDEEK